jgi:glycosyltransferase 2 family protein
MNRPGRGQKGMTRSRRWQIAGRVLTIAFLLLVAGLIGAQAGNIKWAQVGEALRAYAWPTLLAAGVLTALSYTIYGGYELIARAYTRHRLPRGRVAAIAFVSYAFNLSLSAWIGGIGFRYRLYTRNGLHAGLITRILAMSMTTNWLGYMALAGTVFAMQLLPLPEGWKLGTAALQFVGVGLLVVVATYLLLSAFARRRVYRVRGVELRLPAPQMALTQVVVSMANWLVIAGVLFVLLGRGVPFHTVLAVLLVASIAGVVAHIPAGLGVLEAVFLTFLGAKVGHGSLLAALFAYRAIYYLVPLALAVAVYAVLELRARRPAASAALAAG